MNALYRSARTLAAVALLTFGTALPAAALTHGTAPELVSFKTVLTPDWRGVGEYDGILTLTIGDDGIVSGHFREDGGIRTTFVTGGLDGTRIWLDLGQLGLSHIEGTYDGRTITGGTYLGGQNYTFIAAPRNG